MRASAAVAAEHVAVPSAPSPPTTTRRGRATARPDRRRPPRARPTIGAISDRARRRGRRAVRFERGDEHFAALAVEARDDDAPRAVRMRRARPLAIASSVGTAMTGLLAGEREALHGRDADAQSRERSGAGDDGEASRRRRACGRAPRATSSISPGSRSPWVRRVVAGHRVTHVGRRSHSASCRARVAGLERQDHHRGNVILRRCSILAARRASTQSPPVTTSSHPPSVDSATPAMRQYLDVKRQHRDAIVFFRMGDFYEMFYEDALTASRVLELTLTSRAQGRARAARSRCAACRFTRSTTYLGAARPQGLPRRDLRSGRRPAQGQGHRQARSHARGLAGHVHRRVVSRRARAGVPGGACRRPAATGRLGARVPRRLDRRVRRDGIRRRRRAATRSPPSWPCCARRNCWPPTASTSTRACRDLSRRRASRASTPGRSSRPARASALCEQLRTASLAGPRPRARAARRSSAAGAHRDVPARHAAHASSRTSATSRCRVAADALLDRSGHAPAPERRRRRRRRARRARCSTTSIAP